MKKIFIILAFCFLAINNLFAEEFKIRIFNEWLFENGYHQYLNLEQGSNNLNIKIKNKTFSAPILPIIQTQTGIAYLLFMEILL